MTVHKVIYDTDPGIDDAMALLFLHYSPAVDLVGITTVMGNARIETTTRNALYLKERFNIPCPVAQGAAKPLDGTDEEPPAHIHGFNGLGDVALPDVIAAKPDPRPAYQFIIDMVRAHPREICIVAVSRMTNLALALRAAPDIAALVKQVVIMGGAFGFHGHFGNVSPAGEANIHGDALAADEVFGASWPLTAVGLDVTLETLMLDPYLRELRAKAGEVGEFIWDITRLYERFYQRFGMPGISVHDSSAVAFLIAPELFTVRRGPIRVVQDGIAHGATIQKDDRKTHRPGPWDNRPSHDVCVDVQREAFLRLYFDTIVAGSKN